MTKQKSRRMVRHVHDIFGLSAQQKDELAKVEDVFPFQATEYYLSLINWDDPNDPIRKIVVPHPSELRFDGDFDPSNEAANFVAPGVQHKYPHTALIILTDVCAGLCRYCFRKRLFWEDAQDVSQDFSIAVPEVAHDIEPALDYIREHREITNVLLTGGDALMVSTKRLAYVLGELREMSHIGVIRLGTRVPVYYPSRVLDDPELLRELRRISTNQRRVYVVTHFDHPQEITSDSVACLSEFVNNGIPVLNQHPILANINDDPDILVELYRELTAVGVATYYMFMVRPTLGNQAFQVPITRAYDVLDRAKRRLSGIEKRLRLVMSHSTGKISVVAVDDSFIYLKYHRARESENEGQLTVFHRDDKACWLDDLVPVDIVASH